MYKSCIYFIFLKESLFSVEIKNVEVDHAASHLGKAIGITNFIRSIPFNAQHRRALIPQDLVIKYSLSQESFIRHKEKEKVQELVFELASQANSHYQKVGSIFSH